MNFIVQTPTPNLATSLDFYKKLNFKVLSSENPILVSDGKVVIEINPDKYARAGVKFYKKSWTSSIKALQEITNVITLENGHLLSDPSGIYLYLMEEPTPCDFDLEKIKTSTLGNFGGLSLETTDIYRSIAIWEILGFSKNMGNIEQGWVVFQNEEKATVSFMMPNSCPHLFFNPSLNYFNGKNNLAVIEKIKKAEISFTEEITHFNSNGMVDNVIVRDEGGLGFFVFSD